MDQEADKLHREIERMKIAQTQRERQNQNELRLWQSRIESLKAVIKEAKLAHGRVLKKLIETMDERDGLQTNVRMLAIEIELHAQENGKLRERLATLGEDIEAPKPFIPTQLTWCTKEKPDEKADLHEGMPDLSDRNAKCEDCGSGWFPSPYSLQ